MARALKHQSREKQCGTKIRWPGELPARNVATVMTWQDEDGTPVESYHCPWCREYHVGHARYRRSS